MYPTVLLLHSWVRWVVLAAALVVLGRSIAGWVGGRAWTAADNRASAMFSGVLDVQFLLGLLLYAWLSPITWAAFSDLSGAMRVPAMRFWAVEHIFGMLVGLVIVHIGRSRIRGAKSDTQRHRTIALSVGFALVVIAMSIPWPGTPNGRPLLRW